MKHLRRGKYSKQIDYFYEVISQNFSEKETRIFSRNISTLKIFDINKIKAYLCGYEGYYDSKKNVIALGLNKDSIYHELLHLSSTYIDKDKKIHCGISLNSLGYALNEGYTELLARRYFNDSGNAYYIQTNYIEVIEKIIGKKKLENFYLTGDFEGFIKELSKYTSRRDTLKFIVKVDKDIFDYSFNKSYIKKEIVDYLFKSYINFLSEKLFENNISVKQYEKYLLDFISNYNTMYKNEDVLLPYDISKEIDNSLKRVIRKKKVL